MSEILGITCLILFKFTFLLPALVCSVHKTLIYTARKYVSGKVMFLQASVCSQGVGVGNIKRLMGYFPRKVRLHPPSQTSELRRPPPPLLKSPTPPWSHPPPPSHPSPTWSHAHPLKSSTAPPPEVTHTRPSEVTHTNWHTTPPTWSHPPLKSTTPPKGTHTSTWSQPPPPPPPPHLNSPRQKSSIFFQGSQRTREYGQWVGGTHPTGMHSCSILNNIAKITYYTHMQV